MVSVSGGCDLEVRCHGEFDVDGERNQERSDCYRHNTFPLHNRSPASHDSLVSI